jgi:hypothetical protein
MGVFCISVSVDKYMSKLTVGTIKRVGERFTSFWGAWTLWKVCEFFMLLICVLGCV